MGESVRLPRRHGRRVVGILAILGVLAAALLFSATPAAAAADSLARFLRKTTPGEVFPGADRFGPIEGKPSFVRAFKGDDELGYVYLNTDVIDATGYSGKPIHILVGLDPEGVIAGVKLVKHNEPIVLIGIPEKRIREFIDHYRGLDARKFIGVRRDMGEVDVISGATVTVMVIEDSILRSAAKMMRALGIGGQAPVAARGPRVEASVDMSRSEILDWTALIGDGSVRRRLLSVGEINRAYEKSGNAEAAARPEKGPDDDIFIDLYTALVSVPTIGRSLLGEAEYELLRKRLKPGQQAVLIFARGRFSFKGSGYVRGGIFDRIQIIQGEDGVRFRDRDHKRIGDIMAADAPDFREIGLFVIKEGIPFDATEPWRLELLVQRAIGAVKRAYLVFGLGYRLPDTYVVRKEIPAPPPPPVAEQDNEVPLWQAIWRGRMVDIAVLVVALGVLTGIFFFQNILVRHPLLTDRLRLGFLAFTVVWIGYYTQAQLSVVNVLTFVNSLISGFRWDFFLMEPMIFILWVSVAASLVFWGRGAYCGWLCPFGALQELLNRLAKFLKVPQMAVPWAVNERLWPVKYLIFLGIVWLSLDSFGLAERVSEVEPFKTAIVLKFVRDWPYVLYAVILLVVGLFLERFFCRYLCPLGAALAIPGRLRMFEWLKRYRECGSPCQICGDECMVQAIHPEGHINPNECLYCLNCQTLYWDDQRCPALIKRRLRRERRQQRQAAGRAGAEAISAPAETPNG